MMIKMVKLGKGRRMMTGIRFKMLKKVKMNNKIIWIQIQM